MAPNQPKNVEQVQTPRPKKRKYRAVPLPEPPTTPLDQITADSLTIGPSTKRVKVEAEASKLKSQLSPEALAVDTTYNHVVDLRVGLDRVLFSIHDGLLRSSSTVFDSALSGQAVSFILKTNNAEFSMPEEDPIIFNRVNRWFYTGSLRLDGESNYLPLTWATLISIYLFAIKFKITRLQNHCIDDTINKQVADKKLPNAETIGRLWSPEPGAAPLRQLLLQLYAHRCCLPAVMSLPGRFHPDFMKGLVTEMYNMREQKKEIRFWKQRKDWYVNDEKNPVVLDDSVGSTV